VKTKHKKKVYYQALSEGEWWSLWQMQDL